MVLRYPGFGKLLKKEVHLHLGLRIQELARCLTLRSASAMGTVVEDAAAETIAAANEDAW